jgi:hypothetical protein
MTYRHTTYLHGDYLDGDLGPEEIAQVDRHLKECAACREDFERLRRLTATLRKIESPDPGQAYFDGLIESVTLRTEGIEEERAAEQPATFRPAAARRILKTLIRLAAAITLLFMAFYISDFNRKEQSTHWSENISGGGYAGTAVEPIEPADYLPAGLNQAGAEIAPDSNHSGAGNSTDKGQ